MDTQFYLAGKKVKEDAFREVFGAGYLLDKSIQPGDQDDFPNLSTVQVARVVDTGPASMTQRVWLKLGEGGPAVPEAFALRVEWGNTGSGITIPFERKEGEDFPCADFTMGDGKDWMYNPAKGQRGPGRISIVSTDGRALSSERVLGFGWIVGTNHQHANVRYEMFGETPTPPEPEPEPPAENPWTKVLARLDRIIELLQALLEK